MSTEWVFLELYPGSKVRGPGSFNAYNPNPTAGKTPKVIKATKYLPSSRFLGSQADGKVNTSTGLPQNAWLVFPPMSQMES